MDEYPYASTLIMSLSGQQGRAFATAAASLLPLFTGRNSYTLEAWVRFNYLSSDQIIVAAFEQNNPSPMLTLQGGSFVGARSAGSALTSTTQPKQGEWNHVALAYDGKSHLLNLYINGFLEAATQDFQTVDSAAQTLLIGGQMISGTPTTSLNGSVRSVAVWSVCRTQEEVWQDINSTRVPQDGLEAWYGFEQNPVADISGHSGPITITGPLSPQVETTCMQALGDGYGDCGDSESMNFDGQQPFTLEALVNPAEISYQQLVSRYYTGENSGQYVLGIGSQADNTLGSSTTRYFASYCANPSVWWIFSTTQPQVGQWYHAATTYDGHTLSLYVDGELQSDTSWTGPNPNPNVNTLIGALFNQSQQPTEFLNGRLAYVRIWNVCRTAEEIQESMNTDPLNAEGLVANFDFGSMTASQETEPHDAPRDDLTYQNTVTLKGNAAIATFIQPITLAPSQQVTATPDTDQFTTYQPPNVTPELLANFARLVPANLNASADLLSESHLKKFLDEYSRSLPANLSAEQRQQMEEAYQQKVTDLFAKAKEGGLVAIRGDRYVEWASEGDEQVLRYYEPGESHEMLRLSSRDISPEAMWMIEFIATLIIGLLLILGIYATGGAMAKLAKFLVEQTSLLRKIMTIIGAAGAITGSVILEVLDYLFISGSLKKIILIVAKLSFWTLTMFLASLAVTIVAPEARVPQMLAAFAVLAVHLAVLAAEYPSSSDA